MADTLGIYRMREIVAQVAVQSLYAGTGQLFIMLLHNIIATYVIAAYLRIRYNKLRKLKRAKKKT